MSISNSSFSTLPIALLSSINAFSSHTSPPPSIAIKFKPFSFSPREPSTSFVLFHSIPKIKRKPSESSGHQKWRTGVSCCRPFLSQTKDSGTLKKELLEAIAPLDRGADATPEDQERIDQIASKLEAANKVKEPLKSNLLNGKWELLYTTSKSILQTQRPKLLRPNGKICQAINVDTLRAQNMETWPFFNQATTNLVPLNLRRVAVKFDNFKIACLIPIKSAWKRAWPIGNHILG